MTEIVRMAGVAGDLGAKPTASRETYSKSYHYDIDGYFRDNLDFR